MLGVSSPGEVLDYLVFFFDNLGRMEPEPTECKRKKDKDKISTNQLNVFGTNTPVTHEQMELFRQGFLKIARAAVKAEHGEVPQEKLDEAISAWTAMSLMQQFTPKNAQR